MTNPPALAPLPPVHVEEVELLRVSLPLATPWRTALGEGRVARDVLLVRVRAAEGEGWAECPTEPEPTYSSEFTDAATLVLRDHLLPLAWAGPIGDALALGPHLGAVRGHHSPRAALELAVLDAQLRAADVSLAAWLGATAPSVPAGATLGLHDDVASLLAEADVALAAGACRLRVKIAPGRAAAHLAALRAHVGAEMPLQADANGSFAGTDAGRELTAIDGVGLACLEQPLDPADLLGHADLARRLDTPICLDEPLTSIHSIEAAIALGACEVVCLKPARVGGWVAARAIHDRCAQLGVPVWLGGMLETAVGRAANAAVAALPHMTLAPDLDPRPRYDTDLASPLVRVGGGFAVPAGAGIGVVPDSALLATAAVVRSLAP